MGRPITPKGGKRGCLCPDNKYRKECCDGSFYAQGIGATVGGVVEIKIRTVNVRNL